MYRKSIKKSEQKEFENFLLPYGGKLRSDNRWVLLAKEIPWEAIEKKYASQFKENGAPAKSVRIALGSLIIQTRLSLTDVETVQQIRENVYMQYFLGYDGYRDEQPFDSSLLVHFRKRLNFTTIQEINEMICFGEKKDCENDKSNDHSGTDGNQPMTGEKKTESAVEGINEGKLIMDATCVPADIKYPTDLNLLSEARENIERVIDHLHRPYAGKRVKVRMYRNKARRDYLRAAKKRKISMKMLRKALRKQLGYLGRNLAYLEIMKKTHKKANLTRWMKNRLKVIHELYRQQKEMFDQKVNRIPNRIVSLSQPHVRPIVRGKAGAATEFGAKISVSIASGYGFVNRLDWNNFNESVDLKDQVEKYNQRFGVYPESVHADRIYLTRENREYCEKRKIRLMGRGPGRPPEDKKIRRLLRIQQRNDEGVRVAIEGKFGQGKRRYGLSKIMCKLSDTSETMIGLIFLIMNLEKKLKVLLLCLLDFLKKYSMKKANLVFQ